MEERCWAAERLTPIEHIKNPEQHSAVPDTQGVRSPQELIEGESSTTIRRRLTNGSGFHLVKVPYQPAELEERLERLGWRITVTTGLRAVLLGAGIADPTVGTTSPNIST